MSIAEMQEYLELCIEGPSSIPQRQLMLLNKKDTLIKNLQSIQKALKYIDDKQQFYDDVLDNKIEYVSNLYFP